MIKLMSAEKSTYGREVWISTNHVECVSTSGDGTTAIFGNSAMVIAYVCESVEYVVNAVNEIRGKMMGGGV